MKNREYKIPFSAPLHTLDTEYQTYGCRMNNPNACSNYMSPGICAFKSQYHICLHPSSRWSAEFDKLSGSNRAQIQKNLTFPFSAPLCPQDTADQTYGCRRREPNTCPNKGVPGVCAFVMEDHICRSPSRKWRSMFEELKTEREAHENDR